MDVSSPENGLNEINDLLRNDGPCMSDELDLEFLLNKDVSTSYLYNDLVSDDRFQIDVNEQHEEATLLSDFQFGDIAGTASENFDLPRTDCHDVDLSENNFIYDQEKLHYEFQEIHQNEEAEDYIPNDFFKVESNSVEIQVENKISSPTSQFVAEQDANLDRESPDTSTAIRNEKSERASTLEHDEMTRSESLDDETEESVLEEQKEKLHLSCFHQDELSRLPDQSKEILPEHHLNTDKKFTSTSKDTQQMISPSGRHDTTTLSDEIDQSKSPLASMPINASSSKKKCRSHSRSPQRYRDKISVDIDPSSASRKKGGFSSQSAQHHRKRQSCSSGYDRTKHDLIGKSSLSLSRVSTRHPIPYSEGRNPTSRDSWKRPKISSLKHARLSPRYHQPYMRHRTIDRPRSVSPARQYHRPYMRHRTIDRPRSVSPARQRAGYKRDSHCISRSRSPRRRDNHQKLQRNYSPSHRTPPPLPSTKNHSSHRSTYSSPPHRSDSGLGKPGRCLFIAGFCFRTTERDLERKFSKFGRVRDIRVIRDKRSGDSRGFGFLTLERDEDADAAIRALNNTYWNGRVILVEKSNAPS